MKKVRKAVFPVAGLGTRFLPATKAMPKEMLPIVDKPLVQYAVEEAAAAGIEQFIFVTGRNKQAIEDHYDQIQELQHALHVRGKHAELTLITSSTLEPGQIVYTRQQDPLGLGHAVWCARQLVGQEPFAVLLADDLIQARTPCLKQMIDAYEVVGGNLAAVVEVPLSHVSRYGVLDIEASDGPLVRARGVVEKPAPEVAPSTLSIIGRYILAPEVFDLLSSHEPGAGGEIQLTDALARGLPDTPLSGYRFEGRRFDCGSKEGFLEATVAFALERSDLGPAMRRILESYAAEYAAARRMTA